MRWYLYILAFAMLSCSKLEDSGDMVSIIETISADIDTIEIGSSFELEVDREATSSTITIEVYESVEPYVSYKIDDNVIKLSLSTDKADDDLHLKAYVPIDIFNTYKADGCSLVRLNSVLEMDDLTINLSGGSTFVGDINCKNLYYTSTGGSMGYLLGSVTNFNIIECSGGSVIESYGLLAQNIELNISGGSRVELSVDDCLIGSCTGSSSIHYQGSPLIVNVNTSGGSTTVNAD